jgi:membrane protein required for colicin V production
VSLLDLLVLVIIGLSVAAGVRAGFARVGIGFIGAVLGILAGFWFYGIPAAWVHRYIKSATISNLIGFFLVFYALLLAGALIGKLTSTVFKWTGLSWIDRAMGGLFGLVRGAIITIAFIAVIVAFTPKPMPNWMVGSKVLPYAIGASDLMASLAPNPIKRAFRESVQEIRALWNQQLRKGREQLEALRPWNKRKEAEKTH